MAFLATALYLLLFRPSHLLRRPPHFAHLAHHCPAVAPVPPVSFIDRQDSLARTLHALGAAAYVAEPGADAAYYANLSAAAWHLSERPLLLVVTPAVDAAARVSARLHVLTPAFEATRARLLPIPSDSEIAFPEWPEDADPYDVAAAAIPALRSGTVFVDGAMRQFVVDGLQRAAGSGTHVVGAPVEVRRLRERKSREEIEILKCVNEVRSLRSLSPFTVTTRSPGDSARDTSRARRNVHRHARVECPRARRKRPCVCRPHKRRRPRTLWT